MFSGGGARGFAQLGMLKVLEEEGVYPDHVMGSSMGSILGGLYSLGYTAAEVESLMVTLEYSDIIDERQHRPDLYPGDRRWPSYGNLRLALSPKGMPQAPAGLLSGAKIDLGLARLFMPASAHRDFSKLPINFAGLTIDLHTGQLVLHRDGSLGQAVRGAASIPAIIAPFTYDGRTHIDGGLLQNLPAPQLIDLGADRILALKINTSMRGANPKNFYEVLNHILNIAMHTSIDANVELCDLILEPDLKGVGNLDYPNAHAIAKIGEDYARKNVEVIRAFRDSLLAEGYVFTKPERITELTSVPVREIVTKGNRRVPAARIIALSGLRDDVEYHQDDIVKACVHVWNSCDFHTVYPVLEPLESGYRLVLYVREREPRYLHLNTSYSSDERFSLGAVAEFNDIFMPDSRLLAGFTLGGRNELNLDFVKNFGDFNAPYLRLYPYLRQSTALRYNEAGQRTASLDSLEYGIVPGLGFFADKLFSLEAFGYFSQAKSSAKIPSGAPSSAWQKDAGLGLKIYHESLDNDVFPRSGACFFAKTNIAPWSNLSSKNYARLTADLDVYAPLARKVSLRAGFAYGSHFGGLADNATDLISFGGAEAFSGYQKDESPSAEYKYGTLSAVFEPLSNIFLETGAQALNTAGNSDWSLDGSLLFSYYASLGFRSPAGPLGVKFALREDGKANFFFNIGYTTDLFWFSRK
ncbi:MAG TPA: patatin-like phospholipase family protein [Candidatus Syntrophosphaera sp.]|nr:patatin-like phospholipase family protein [Candidatus Syntrophosphaera sp.]